MLVLTNQLPPGSRDLLEKLTGSHLVKKFPAFYGTRRFITVPIPKQTTKPMSPRPTSWRSILITLPPTPWSPKWPLSLKFPHQNPVCTSPNPHTCYMPSSSHSSLFDHPNNIWWVVQIITLGFKFVLRNGCKSWGCGWLDESLALLYAFSYFNLAKSNGTGGEQHASVKDPIWLKIHLGANSGWLSYAYCVWKSTIKTSKIIKLHNLQFNHTTFQKKNKF